MTLATVAQPADDDLSLAAEARYVARGDTKFIRLVVALSFGGSNK